LVRIDRTRRRHGRVAARGTRTCVNARRPGRGVRLPPPLRLLLLLLPLLPFLLLLLVCVCVPLVPCSVAVARL
jgi:hypothetical protein